MEPNYTESQDELYEGATLLATSMDEELADLAAFKAKYDAALVNGFRNLISTAINLPDDDQRVIAHEVLRIHLVKYTDKTVRSALGALRLYIRDAYEDIEEREARLREAGFNDYEAAMKYNWEKLKGELKNANDFITAHSAELLLNNNMPPAFPADVTTIKTNVDARVTQLLNLRENAKQGTQAKINANNVLNTAKNAICEDGQYVFRNNEAKRAQFVWDSIMELVSPPGRAGLKFTAKELGTNLPIPNAVGTFQKEGGTPVTSTTGPDGKAILDNLEPGKYKGSITHPAYITLNVEFEINTGATTFKHWLLEKII